MKKKLIKKILMDVMNQHIECCSVCKMYGQNLQECKCRTYKQCVKHMLKLAKKAYKKA